MLDAQKTSIEALLALLISFVRRCIVFADPMLTTPTQTRRISWLVKNFAACGCAFVVIENTPTALAEEQIPSDDRYIEYIIAQGLLYKDRFSFSISLSGCLLKIEKIFRNNCRSTPTFLQKNLMILNFRDVSNIEVTEGSRLNSIRFELFEKHKSSSKYISTMCDGSDFIRTPNNRLIIVLGQDAKPNTDLIIKQVKNECEEFKQ